MPTIGYTGVGSGSDASLEGWISEANVTAADRYIAVTGDVVTQVAAYGDGTGACEIAVYTYSGGVPVTKVNSQVINFTTTPGWHTATVSWALTGGVEYVVAIDYYVGGSWNIRYDNTQGTTNPHSPGANESILPATWTAGTNYTSRNSFYATVNTALPYFVSAGSGVVGLGATLAIPYPTTFAAGDLLIMQVVHDGAATLAASGWHLWFEDDDTNPGGYLFMKKATGSESGTMNVTGASASIKGRMYSFRNWYGDDSTWANNFEGANTQGQTTSTTIAGPSITTTAANRLAVAFVWVHDDNPLDAFTGMSGGTWSEAVAEFASATNVDQAIGVQTALMVSAGTISGGSDTMASDPWLVYGFAIKPPAVAASLPPRRRRRPPPGVRANLAA